MMRESFMKLFYFLCMVCFLICNSSCSDLVHDGIDSQNQYRTFSISGKIIHENYYKHIQA